MFSSKDLFFTSPATGYRVSNSLRFRSSASAYLSRTPASASNQKTWTWSGWVKRGALGGTQALFTARSASNPLFLFEITSDQLTIFARNASGTTIANYTSAAVFRDPSAWYHIVLLWNAASTTMTIYVNNVAQTLTTTTAISNVDYAVNSTIVHEIARHAWSASDYFDGYLAEVNFIDGQALTPSSFGANDATTGVWQPKAYTGTYGTNGFYLKFSDASAATAAAIGKDYSGNGNNWTPTNISVTAGTTYDSMIDSPTNATGDVGNYAVLNVNNQLITAGSGGSVISQGNLLSTGPAVANSGSFYPSTLAVSSGKWYAEATIVTAGTANSNFGIIPSSLARTWSGAIGVSVGIFNSTASYILKNGAVVQSSLPAWANGDVCGIAVDMNAGTVQYYRNNSAYGAQVTGITAVEYCIGLYTSQDSLGSISSVAINFGQRPFTYTPPSGFKALCTQNLPTPTIGATSSTLANKYFDVSTYAGNSSTQNITNSGSFQPDFVWIKNRSGALSHYLSDAVRGVYRILFSNLTNAEYDGTSNSDGVSAFNANGFTVLNGTNAANYNAAANNYVAWQWKAGGAVSPNNNTSGSITSTVSASVASGFSVVTYTGTGANATVGHGLGVAPSMIIVKVRSTTNDWPVYHSSIGNTTGVGLNLTSATFTPSASYWNNTSPTSTVFSVGNGTTVNQSTQTYVAYCFAPVAGYSAFGSYTGNGSADGPFVYTGFRPRYVLIKCTNAAGTGWYIYDTARNTYNVMDLYLRPEVSDAEGTLATMDTLSNGFKLRSSNSQFNGSGNTYLYAAFCENPFKYSLAR